jgi:hypothetical protein
MTSSIKAPKMPTGTFMLRCKSGGGLVHFETFRVVGPDAVEVRKMWGDDRGGFAPEQMTKDAARKWWTRCLKQLGYTREN